jgi:hypothetical protein
MCRKLGGSIPDGVIEFFFDLKPSGSTVSVGSTQPLTEISTRYVSLDYRWPLHRADNIATFTDKYKNNNFLVNSFLMWLSHHDMQILVFHNIKI